MGPKKSAPDATASRRIVFFHPDLGIGGAERLIIDAAVGLQELGHKVTIFTSHCDPQHCFEEARDGTLDVRVRGNTIFPPTILNRLHILLAILRQIHLVLSVAFFGDELFQIRPDVFIVDQLSACVPLLRWICSDRQRTLFYCHFPDQLLADRKRGGIAGLVKAGYRLPFDWFEGWSTAASDKIVVNSNFTRSIASKVIPAKGPLTVIYPCVSSDSRPAELSDKPLWDGKFKLLLSVNRFERKKDIGLALHAYNGLTEEERRGTRLILAGGYDSRVAENLQYHQELVQMAEEMGLIAATVKTAPTALGISDDVEVLFMLSIPGAFKATLMSQATLLLYTPVNEHFGIVPVEAMQHGLPVLASNTGGPLETVVEGETGWLRDASKVEQWTQVMRTVLVSLSPKAFQQMKVAGQRRASENFTRVIMAKKFDAEIKAMLESKRSDFVERQQILMGVGLIAAVAAALIATIVGAYAGKPLPADLMAEVISLLSSPPINPGKRSREKLPTRLPVADLFGSDDFDTTGDLDFHGEQPKKRRKPSPAPEAVIAARSGPQTLIAELDLSSEPDLPPSSAPADPGPSRPSFLDAFADDDEDDIEFSSSAPAISKNHRSKLDAVVHILSSDSITADDGARTRESAAPAAPAFSARVMEVLGAANISLRDDSGSKRIGKAANTSYKPTKPVRRSKNAIDDIIVSSPPSAASKKKSQASRADKEAQSTASKREREAAKEAEKQRKNDAKLEREKEKQKAKDMAEVNKSKANKKETSKEMILEMHGSLESTSIGDQVEEYMRQHEIQFSYTREEVSLSESAQHLDAGKTLRWKRKIEAAYDEDEGQWVPLDRSRIDLIDHVVILISGSEFASVALGSSDPDDLSESPSLEAMKRNLDRHMEHTRRQHKDRRLIYLIQGLHAWIKKNQNAKNREYTAAVRAQVAEETSNGPPASSQARKRKRAPASRHLAAVTADLAEDLQLYLQINHQPLVIHHTTSDAATASQILSFTQSLSARPYRLAELEHNLKSSSFYMGSGQFKTGDGVQETFCRMLEGQQRVTPSIAQSIAAEWPSPRELVAAFRTSDNLMLENVRKSTNKDGGYSDKRIGPVISKRMYKVFLGRIPEATDGMS